MSVPCGATGLCTPAGTLARVGALRSTWRPSAGDGVVRSRARRGPVTSLASRASAATVGATGLTGASLEEVREAVHGGDVDALAATDGHFSAVSRDGQTVRLARTVGLPLRYFVAKMFHGPFLVTADRIDRLYAWCREQKIGWHPHYSQRLSSPDPKDDDDPGVE